MVSHNMSRGNPQLIRPLKVTLSLSNSCNLNCRYCYNDCSAGPSPPELSVEEWKNLLDQLYEDEVIGLYIDNVCEPLNNPGVTDILQQAGDRFHVQLRTNGTLLTRKLTGTLAKDCGIAILLVDLFSADAAIHDEATGVKGSFERTLAGIQIALRTGLETQILTIMTKRNVGGLQAWIDLAQSIGVKTVGILRPYPLGRMKRLWNEVSLSMQEMMDALADLRIPPGMKLMHSWHPKDGNCCWQNAAIDAVGNSIGCAYLREYVNFGNLREKSFMETWNHPLHMTLRSGNVKESCPSCSRTQGSHGGCRSTAYAYTRSWDLADPFCSHLNNGVDLRVLPDWSLLSDKGRETTPGT